MLKRTPEDKATPAQASYLWLRRDNEDLYIALLNELNPGEKPQSKLRVKVSWQADGEASRRRRVSSQRENGADVGGCIAKRAMPVCRRKVLDLHAGRIGEPSRRRTGQEQQMPVTFRHKAIPH